MPVISETQTRTQPASSACGRMPDENKVQLHQNFPIKAR